MPENTENRTSVYAVYSIYIFSLMCVVIHLWLVYFFYKLKIYPLAALNLISCLVYIIITASRSFKRVQRHILTSIIEITIFCFFSTIMLSFECGLFLYCLPMPLTGFVELDKVKHKKFVFAFTSVAMLLEVPLTYFATPYFTGYREAMKPYNTLMLVTNFVIVIISYIYSAYAFMNRAIQSTSDLKFSSEHDGLTGLYNRNYFNQFTAIADSKRNMSGCVMIFDIDDFKKINDEFGHDIGDKALKMVSSIAQGLIRSDDTIVRWGGEEFVIFIEKIDAERAREKAEDIRSEIASTPYHEDHCLTVTLGITQLEKGEKFLEAVKRADDNLYTGKTTGKNKVVAD